MGSSNVVVAAGFIIFRRITNLMKTEYLLLKASYGDYHWSPPKGHVDEGESEFETALRETQEEAGFTREQLCVVDGFKYVLNYEVRGKPKRVEYWLAEFTGQTEVKLSNEHTEYKWLELKEALEFAKYEDLKKSLTEADEFINSRLS
ncbi:bis(5'-nucleosyl)-tetraphosphatase [asymmetrical]-like [Dreissena polymorpha]|uniref:Bis(5'-nucleosyl)-tetraphosphatase [asymmetrical] n=1 Tax=Dreissena polymorpha TaxID=45954 RepID=A0A9D4KD36_DREPO|nr:bis(5'-nucleosyl)-tetraphosphatase [asymmetrical]-like [Dreissena polymorpha]KAH3837608.1 hypothetical protein DPMN_111005 [Dreissena polymorpha]